MTGSDDERSENDAHIEIKVMVEAMLAKAPALAPTEVRTRKTRRKREILQGSKARRLRPQKTPPQNKLGLWAL